MTASKKIIAIVFISLAAGVTVLPLAYCNKYVPNTYHKFLASEEFKQKSRADRLMQCASCHRQQYDNELKGPHSFAYKSLKEHRDFVNSSSYQCDFYTAHVNRSYEGCMGCHAPQNLYETILKDTLRQPLLLAEKLFKADDPRPFARNETATRITGIDCLSCHVNDNQVVSLKHTFQPDDSSAAHQTHGVITANNMNCYVCHFDIVREFNPEIAIRRTGSALCVNCHQEHDAQGKGTHYYYWQHDAPEKKNPKPELLLNDFSLVVNEANDTGVITWKNTIIPHKISPGPEMVLFCDVLNKDSAILGSKTIRINKKKVFDEKMYSNLENNYLSGIPGDDVPIDNETLSYQFPVIKPEDAAWFRISFMHKSQYWFPDSLGKITLIKTYPYQKEANSLPQ